MSDELLHTGAYITANCESYIKNSDFIDPEQWDFVIEAMASTIHPKNQLEIFQKLKRIAEKMVKPEAKYRQLYLNNVKLRKNVLEYDGGLEFLYNLGFAPDPEHSDMLFCKEVDQRVIQACLICLDCQIEQISYDAENMQLSIETHSIYLYICV